MKLGITAIAISVVALGVVVIAPNYVKNEEKAALARQAEIEAQAAVQRRTPPSNSCEGDYYSVTDYSGQIPVTLPVGTKDGVVMCDSDGYTVNGESITPEQIKKIVASTLSRHREREAERSSEPSGASGMPTFDPASYMQTLNEALAQDDLTPSQRGQVELLRDQMLGAATMETAGEQ